jgi:hypothetical protein
VQGVAGVLVRAGLTGSALLGVALPGISGSLALTGLPVSSWRVSLSVGAGD